MIGFNVGGQIFPTSKTTIEVIPNSFLGRLALGNIPSKTDENGNFIIDRNPRFFQNILDVYRIGLAVLPTDPSERTLFVEELKFYNLEDRVISKSNVRLVGRIKGNYCASESVYVIGDQVVKITYRIPKDRNRLSISQCVYIRCDLAWKELRDPLVVATSYNTVNKDVQVVEDKLVNDLRYLILDVHDLDDYVDE